MGPTVNRRGRLLNRSPVFSPRWDRENARESVPRGSSGCSAAFSARTWETAIQCHRARETFEFVERKREALEARVLRAPC